MGWHNTGLSVLYHCCKWELHAQVNSFIIHAYSHQQTLGLMGTTGQRSNSTPVLYVPASPCSRLPSQACSTTLASDRASRPSPGALHDLTALEPSHAINRAIIILCRRGNMGLSAMAAARNILWARRSGQHMARILVLPRQRLLALLTIITLPQISHEGEASIN